MTKRIEFSQHALLKIEILESRGVTISTDLISELIRTPTKQVGCVATRILASYIQYLAATHPTDW